MTFNNPHELIRAVLPPALELLTAWSIAETDGDPSVFHNAMDRTVGDAAHSDEPLRGLAQMMFGLSSLSGILLDELARQSGRSHSEVLQAVHHHYLNPTR
ncbi:MAG: hypothetical protein ABR608_04235 [Pseudonocardiaceae bacterium]